MKTILLDAIHDDGRPEDLGMSKHHNATEWQLSGYSSATVDNVVAFRDRYIQRYLTYNSETDNNGRPYYEPANTIALNIESWNGKNWMQSDVLRSYQQALPESGISFYNVGFVERGLGSGQQTQAQVKGFITDCEESAVGVLEHADYICPSMYWSLDWSSQHINSWRDRNEWMAYVARTYRDKYNVPIMAYISPYKYSSGGNPEPTVSGRQWAEELAFLNEWDIDYAAIWTSSAAVRNPWNPNAPWWQETQTYLAG